MKKLELAVKRAKRAVGELPSTLRSVFLGTRLDGVTDGENLRKLSNGRRQKVRLVANTLCCLLAIAALTSGGLAWKSWAEYKASEKTYSDMDTEIFYRKISLPKGESKRTTYIIDDATDTEEAETSTGQQWTYDHEALLAVNDEAAGYLWVPGADIRLPVVQTDNNDYYLKHSIDKSYNSSGTPFIDYRIADGLDAGNVIIYAHNMKNGGMFANLAGLLSPDTMDDPEKNAFYIYTGREVREYRIFSMYISKPYGGPYVYDVEDVPAYALEMQQASSYYSDIDVSGASQVVTLSTCTGDGKERIIIQGVLQ